MKRLILGLIAISTFTGSIIACSSSSNGGSAADACSNIGNALVAYTEKCQGTLDPSVASAYGARYAQLCQAEVALPGTALNYASQLSACASAVQSADCNTDTEQLAACNALPSGTLANGTACAEDLQCQSGSCSAGSTGSSSSDGGESSTTNCGQCQPAIADGASCQSGGTCVSGDTCVFNSDPTTGTFTAICTKKPAPAAVGGTCTTSDDCAAPNHCAPPVGSSETGVCATPGVVGTSCGESTDCSSGLVCAPNGSGGGPENTCVTALAEGAACTENQCGTGLACDTTTSKCTKFTFAAPGAACDGVAKLCSKGICNTSSGDGGTGGSTCPTIIADGQPCDVSDRSATCDEFANCAGGTCVFIPATCN